MERDPRVHDVARGNLAWGKRFTGDDRWPTVEAMLIDVDGDGLVDRLTNTSTSSTCQATWQKNLGLNADGTVKGFTTGGTITLPRLKWHRRDDADFSGSPDADADEGCALNAMWTWYRNSSNTGAANYCHDNSVCRAATNPNDNAKYCFASGRDCRPDFAAPDNTALYRTYVAYRWMDVDADGLTDLVAAVHGNIDHYDIESGNGYNGLPIQNEPMPLGATAWPACPVMDRCAEVSEMCVKAARSCTANQLCTINWAAANTCLAAAPAVACQQLTSDWVLVDKYARASNPGNSNGPPSRKPYARCEGLYPWFIYKNQGAGVFATVPTIKYSPVELESDTGDSNLSGPGVMAQHHAIMDIDGDGYQDAVARINGRSGQPGGWPIWYVWRGDGTGGFEAKRYSLFTREAPQNYLSSLGFPTGNITTGGTVDLNGDGLPEHWFVLTAGGTAANIALSAATSYRLFGPPAGSKPIGELGTATGVRPSQEALVTTQLMDVGGVKRGYTRSANRLTDLDADGRPDVAVISSTGLTGRGRCKPCQLSLDADGDGVDLVNFRWAGTG